MGEVEFDILCLGGGGAIICVSGVWVGRVVGWVLFIGGGLLGGECVVLMGGGGWGRLWGGVFGCSSLWCGGVIVGVGLMVGGGVGVGGVFGGGVWV